MLAGPTRIFQPLVCLVDTEMTAEPDETMKIGLISTLNCGEDGRTRRCYQAHIAVQIDQLDVPIRYIQRHGPLISRIVLVACHWN